MAFTPGKGRASKYDATHQKARARAKANVTPLTPCARCGHALGPEHRISPAGRRIGLWHYDHDEHGGYLGFSHGGPCSSCGRRCNVKAGASKGARIKNAQVKLGKVDRPAKRWRSNHW